MYAARNPGRKLEALYTLPVWPCLQLPLIPFNVTIQPFQMAQPTLVLQSIIELIRER